jgi:photosystem II stability/assembly factor-like uncharacterized protein
MKKALLFTLFFSIILQGFSQWTTLNIPSAGRYDDVFFINESVGWAAGGNSEKIYKTTNGGTTWTMQYNTGKYLRSIEFATPMLGFCGSLESSLFKTTDGGITWIDIAPSISPVPQGICGLSAPSANVIYGCGIWSEPAFVIKSTDGGTNWTNINLSQYATALVDIFFASEDVGFVVGKSNPASDGGIVLYTADGGITWEVKHKTFANEDYIWKLQTPDSLHYYGSLDALPSSGNVRIVKSADAGLTWTTDTIRNTYSYMQTIGFMDAQHGWSGGLNTLFETIDGGENWNPITVGSAYNRFFRVNENTAFLSGDRIYKYTNGTPTSNQHLGFADEIHSLRVSPNPFHDYVEVEMRIGNKTRSKLQLYSSDGKLLQTLYDGMADKGIKHFTVDCSGMASQILFLVLKTNEELVYRKLVKE